MDEEAVLGHLPESIRAEIATSVHAATLRRVAIFRECETGLLTQLVLKLRPSAFGPGDYDCERVHLADIGQERTTDAVRGQPARPAGPRWRKNTPGATSYLEQKSTANKLPPGVKI